MVDRSLKGMTRTKLVYVNGEVLNWMNLARLVRRLITDGRTLHSVLVWSMKSIGCCDWYAESELSKLNSQAYENRRKADYSACEHRKQCSVLSLPSRKQGPASPCESVFSVRAFSPIHPPTSQVQSLKELAFFDSHWREAI